MEAQIWRVEACLHVLEMLYNAEFLNYDFQVLVFNV
jgi:hypothetical protein